MRREFAVPVEEVEGFEPLYQNWEALKNGQTNWLLIRGFPIPTGYNVNAVDLAVQILPGYPRERLDMVYVFPALKLVKGRTIPTVDVTHMIDGRAFQRWSRHYNWDSARHNISIHLQFASEWFERELTRT